MNSMFSCLDRSLGRVIWRCLALFALSLSGTAAEFRVGTASVDVTPEYSVRLSGYASRQKESEGTKLPLKAKAAALESGGEVALILTVDNVGISREIWETIVQRIQGAHGIPSERIVIFSSHTHSAPALSGAINNIFVAKLPDEQQAKIDRYTAELADKMVAVAGEAVKAIAPAKLYFGKGRAGFAKNRRTEGGPVDHDLPLLVARDDSGKLLLALANYACHCTTLQGDHNFMHGDWAGVAQAELEKAIPGMTAMISIGCGADSNPNPRGQLEHVTMHGQEIAREVQYMLEGLEAGQLEEITSAVGYRAKDCDLPYEPLPTREDWERRAKEPAIVGFHAKQNLERLDRGELLPTALPYRVQTWNFGGQLAMVFLPGEVVVDYVKRLKEQFDPERLWVSAYANWVPCYIPSTRILQEGGYEAESSLWYYDRPARLSTNTESLILTAAREQIPSSFKQEPKFAGFPAPKSPQRSLAAIRMEPPLPHLQVHLVASEPLIASPVAIDWSADGRLWVVEMRDFPSGMDGNLRPGGRVKILRDTNGDGAMDEAETFLENLPFPTGITCWNGGALICAAPDILFARDTNGDGKADEVRKLFSGFATDNYQARVNSLSLGLDGWFYGANGLIGGRVSGGSLKTPLNISNRDFRFRPDTGAFETASGLTQQGRVRDDFGNWFGCDNSTLLWHYPLQEEDLRRNSNFAPPATRASIAAGTDPNRLRPVSEAQERFNFPEHVNRTTSACGVGIYRDELLGSEFYGNAFVCEPVHNLVRRMVLTREGATFKAIKPESERREFLASQDSWFRPVQVRTGPDGALWVVDMYRMVVEHPRWITPERLATLDLRAGEDLGRIYRVLPKGKAAREVINLEKLTPADLVARLDTANGTERDRVQLEMMRRKDGSIESGLSVLAKSNANPAVQAQAISALHSLGRLDAQQVLAALNSSDENLRAFAVSMCDGFSKEELIERKLLSLTDDSSPAVRFQLASALGNFRSSASTEAIVKLFKSNPDSWTRSALLCSITGRALEVAEAMDTIDPAVVRPLVETAVREGSSTERIVSLVARSGNDLQVWQLDSLEALLRLKQLPKTESGAALLKSAQEIVLDGEAAPQRRAAAVRALAYAPGPEFGEAIRSVLISGADPELISAAASAAVNRGEVTKIYEQWKKMSPAARRAFTTAVLRRRELVLAHLAHLEQDRSLAELSTADRQQLLKSADGKVRTAAERLFPVRPSSRQEAFGKFRTLDMKAANPGRGSELFATHCASCHHFRGQGFPVGPNLGALTERSTSFLLGAIIDPNAAVENRYLAYTVDTVQGDAVTGIISDENASSLTIANANGTRQTVLRKDVASIRALELSLMPEGLEQIFSPEDMASLIAFVQFTPAQFGTTTGPRAVQARAAFAESATPVRVRFASEKNSYASWAGTAPMNHCRQTDGKSRVEWESPVQTNQLGEATFQFPVALGFLSQPPGTFELHINGRHALTFDATTADDMWQSADGAVTATYLVMDRNEQDSSGILRLRVKRDLLSGKSATFIVRGSAASSQRWFGIYEFAETRTARP